MQTPDPTNSPDQDFTQALRQDKTARSTHCPSLVDLAAYIDGFSAEDETHSIELHLSRCSTCLQTVREIRQSQTQEEGKMVFVPPHILASAMALVREREAGSEPAWSRPALRRTSSWILIARGAAALAASVAIGMLGFHVGSTMPHAFSASNSIDSTDEMLLSWIDSSSHQVDYDLDLAEVLQ